MKAMWNLIWLLFALALIINCSCRNSNAPSVQSKDSSAKLDVPGLRLIHAYPQFLSEVRNDSLIWKDGTSMLFDDGNLDKSISEIFNTPDIEDQITYFKYPSDSFEFIPPRNFDPGRIRYEDFFRKMYGANKKSVEANLAEITWLPSTAKIRLKVTRINNVHLKLQEVSNELDSLKYLQKYLQNPGGAYNWRHIKGTERISTHSFGIAIDINIRYSNYWQWDNKTTDEQGADLLEYKNRIPLEIVKIFEKHGFIWGGRWYHYDTMHFEYRPELL